MKQVIVSLILSLLVGSAAGAWLDPPLNYEGYGDTNQISAFKADSLRYSKVFPLSQWENLRVRICFNDTAATGYANDSANFYYFIQTGAPCLDAGGKLDTAWDPNVIMVDTIDPATAGNWGKKYNQLYNDGTFTETMKTLDSAEVTGYATNSHALSMPWNVYLRVGVKGLSHNKIGKFIKVRVDVLRRDHVNVQVK